MLKQTPPSRNIPAVVDALLHGRFAYRIARLILAAAFLVAGVIKLSDPDAFAGTIAAFGILPAPLVDWAALLLPIIEVLAAIALLWDARGGLSVITALTLVFIAVLGYGLWLGLDIDCGCYGPGDPNAEAFSSLRTSLYRDFVLLGIAGYCMSWRMMNRRTVPASKHQ
ncbi:MauE/DoxX family redox-associated membrane protein [Oceanidesulfovibrio marinus]|uniref:MauE/DoxX family redox-associated membrane protein n=1 Tax=Oceanidesulfovibrio marinus TaxID=370038 RepID=UPI00148B1F40|nr:MauE/DoxX family redox-associated membrane protein [Oceanidesulfovibrio marinus]